jgi:hypothetical protein
MRFIRSAATTLTLAGKMAFAGIATLAAFTVPALTTPAFATGPPVVQVSPQVAAPGNNVNIVVVCGAGATSATLYGPTIGSPQIPMTPTSPRHFSAMVSLPTNISPGTYSPSITCNNQNNQVTNNVTTSITVNPAPGPPLPIGPPLTGDGATSSVTGGPFALAGVALLGTGGLAVGAGVIRKRRRSGTRMGGGRPTR